MDGSYDYISPKYREILNKRAKCGHERWAVWCSLCRQVLGSEHTSDIIHKRATQAVHPFSINLAYFNKIADQANHLLIRGKFTGEIYTGKGEDGAHNQAIEQMLRLVSSVLLGDQVL